MEEIRLIKLVSDIVEIYRCFNDYIYNVWVNFQLETHENTFECVQDEAFEQRIYKVR